MAEKITQAQLAALLGVSQPWIAKLKSKGVLTRWDNLGALLIEGWKHSAAEASGRVSQNAAGLDLVEERARLAARQSEKLELELAIMRGDLITESSIAEHFQHFAVTIRAKLLAVPSRFRSMFPGLSARQVDYLDNIVREILQELSVERFPGKYRAKLRQQLAAFHPAAKADSQPVGGRAPLPKPRVRGRARQVVDQPDSVHGRAVPGNNQPRRRTARAHGKQSGRKN